MVRRYGRLLNGASFSIIRIDIIQHVGLRRYFRIEIINQIIA